MSFSGPAPASTPGSILSQLHREGRLATEYPQITALLADVPEAELLRAGRLLSRLDPDQVLRHHPAVPTITVAVTGHGTLSALVPALTAELARHGLLIRPHIGDFDSYVFDLGDPGSDLYAADPDLTLCVLDPAIVFDDVPVPWRLTDVERVIEEKLGLFDRLAARFAATSHGVLVLNTMPLLRGFAAQLVDHQSRALLGARWREANARLLRMTEAHPCLVVLDLEPLIAEGIAASDARLSVYTKSHLSPDLLARYAREVGHLARHLTGRAKKTLVLDLDNTLWGGVLGEDGMDGVEVADSYRGEAFRAFQRVVKQIGSQGVLLAVASKNDVEPVREVLREHPRMTLREDDFVRVSASWRPKTEIVAELAEALNLGVDAFALADDSAFECHLVRQTLPGVTVIQLDDEPALHVEKLLRDGWFDVRELTAEDRSRVEKYREDLIRGDFLDTFDSIEDYLRELQVTVRLAAVGEKDAARVSQLTLRTNQFNLTTERLQVTEILALVEDPAALVLAIHASDRFGDNGLVGAVLARRDGATLRIDNFLLSCRVFSRGIEQACLAAVLRHARAAAVEEVLGTYHKTAKNGRIKDFYSRYGFDRIHDDGAMTTFRHSLTEIMAPPEHVRLTESFGGPVS